MRAAGGGKRDVDRAAGAIPGAGLQRNRRPGAGIGTAGGNLHGAERDSFGMEPDYRGRHAADHAGTAAGPAGRRGIERFDRRLRDRRAWRTDGAAVRGLPEALRDGRAAGDRSKYSEDARFRLQFTAAKTPGSGRGSAQEREHAGRVEHAMSAIDTSAPSHYVEFRNVYKTFDHPVLVDVNFHVDAGETLAIIGRSGVGKSVTLSHIMGFLKPDKGRVIAAYM